MTRGRDFGDRAIDALSQELDQLRRLLDKVQRHLAIIPERLHDHYAQMADELIDEAENEARHGCRLAD